MPSFSAAKIRFTMRQSRAGGSSGQYSDAPARLKPETDWRSVGYRRPLMRQSGEFARRAGRQIKPSKDKVVDGHKPDGGAPCTAAAGQRP